MYPCAPRHPAAPPLVQTFHFPFAGHEFAMFSRPKLSTLVAIAAAVCLPGVVRAEPIGIAWRTNLDAAKLEAAQTGRLLLLHFQTQSCAPCRVLDQTVLSQPQVGAVVERDYVPVKVDADAQPALRNWFKITHVPAEVVLTPQGNVVATLSPPDNPDAYIAQVQNLSRHFRQSTPSGAQQGPAVNAAYAGLPTNGPAGAAAMTRYNQGAPAPGATSYAGAAGPQSQNNAHFAGTAPATAAGPSMPPNAMPTSYRPMFAAPPVAAGPGARSVAATQTPTAQPPAVQSPAMQPPVAGQPIIQQPIAQTPGVQTPSAQPAIAQPQIAQAQIAHAPIAQTPSAPVVVTAPSAGPAAVAPTSPYPNTATMARAAQAAAPPQGVAMQPAQPPLPPNSPPVAFDGCCPVTLKSLNKWTPGSTTFGAVHRGRTYLFVSEPQRQQFLADPDAYSPVFAGYDPVLLLEKQQTVPGSRKFGFRYGGAFYLFSSRETMARFESSPHTYAAGVRQAMARVDAPIGGGVFRR